jgi:pyruvate formate lyase activating enzyme
MGITGIIFNIKRFAIHDGPGIRTTVFLKGCPLKCPWCHNPEGIKKEPEKMYSYKNKHETIGEMISVSEVMEKIEKDTIFYDQSGGGVTISGGEPLMQPEFLESLLKECKKKEIHSALDTSGYADPELFQRFIDLTDLFLYDLKIMEDSDHIKSTGVSNHNILKNLKTLSKHKKRIFIRFPIVPGETDSEGNILKVVEFIRSLNSVEKIDLLPYHKTAVNKYIRLNKTNPVEGIKPPVTKRLNQIKRKFDSLGLALYTNIGG